MLGSAVAGLVSGGAFALLGVCLVLMFRMVAVVNFAQGATGVIGIWVVVVLTDNGWGYLPAALTGALAGAAVAVVLGLVMNRWFLEASPEHRSTVAIAMLIGLLVIGNRLFGNHPRNLPAAFQGELFTIGGVAVTGATLVAVGAAIVVAAAAAIVLARTRIGLMLRALSERPTTAQLHGLPIGQLSLSVWAITGAVATIGILIVAPTRPATFANLSLLVLPGLAAALVGLFRRLGVTVVAGLLLGVIDATVTQYDSLQPYRQAIPLVIILAVLLVSQRGRVWDEAR